MKKGFRSGLFLAFIVVYATLVYAGGGPTLGKTESASSPIAPETLASYRANVGDKAARGVKNILFGWTEFPKRVVDITQETNNPVWGLFAGTFQGTLKAMARTVSGVSDVATAPIAPEKDSFIQADIDVD